MTFEAIEGIIDGVNANDKGTGFLLEGQPPNTWFNFSRVLPRDYQDGLTLPEKPPEITKGQRVRFLYETSGRWRNIQVNADGSHEFSVLDTTPPPQNASQNGSSYQQDKEQAILWAVCLKLAGDMCISNCQNSTDFADPFTVLGMAEILFKGGPNGSGDPIKAETQRVMSGVVGGEIEKAVPAQVAQAPNAYGDTGDPGPTYQGEEVAT